MSNNYPQQNIFRRILEKSKDFLLSENVTKEKEKDEGTGLQMDVLNEKTISALGQRDNVAEVQTDVLNGKAISALGQRDNVAEVQTDVLNGKAISACLPDRQALGRATMSTKITCPYCDSTNFVKRGVREKKHEVVQLYLCRAEGCGRTFTAERVKGKRFPLHVILEGISYYNLGLSLEQTCNVLGQKFPDVVAPIPATLSSWVEEYKPICRFERMRPYAIKLFSPEKMIEVTTMAHRQLYRFRYHRAKTLLVMEEFKNRRFDRLKEYLDNVSAETPHQYFADGERMSEIRSKFDKTDMIVKSKSNFANKIAEFVLRSVTDNQGRHEALQRFMIANDSVTVATEVPVYIRREDVEHMENELKFKITTDGLLELKGDKQARRFPKLLTGHIDFVQIRNGMVHILDYKPGASKEKPIEQLTWYALALSRLTGLRLYEFKCAWFDDKDFYEFYPLHIVKKLRRPAAGVAGASGRRQRKRIIHFKDGTKAEVPREDIYTVAGNPDVKNDIQSNFYKSSHDQKVKERTSSTEKQFRHWDKGTMWQRFKRTSSTEKQFRHWDKGTMWQRFKRTSSTEKQFRHWGVA